MSNDIITAEFREFGERMNIILICFVLNFIIPVLPGIVMAIYVLMCVGNIKRINQQLNNRNLQKFRSFFISSILLFLFTGVVMIIAMIPFILNIVPYVMEQDFSSMTPDLAIVFLRNLMPTLIPLLIIGGIGIILIFIAGIIQMKAWVNLHEFFKQNTDLFPENIAYDAVEGSKNLKTASLCLVLSFLGITVLIALIYLILGYSKLSRLRRLGGVTTKSSIKPQIAPQAAPQAGIKYCPSCGTQVKEGEGFCVSCGEKL